MSRHTIREWEKIKGVQILDPDGFDRKDPELMTRTFNEHEFNEGMMGSTVRMRSVTTPTSTDDELRIILENLCEGIDEQYYDDGSISDAASDIKALYAKREREAELRGLSHGTSYANDAFHDLSAPQLEKWLREQMSEYERDLLELTQDTKKGEQ